MYSQDKIDVALKVFHQCGSVTTTIRVLGYPTRRALYTWIANERSVKSERYTRASLNGCTPFELALHLYTVLVSWRCFHIFTEILF